jgi:hypothetical protein
MELGFALQAMQSHKYIAYRKGWNGKAMFLFLQEGRSFETPSLQSWGVDQLPQAAFSKIAQEANVRFLPRICMYTATKEVCVGWLASQTDMLCADWVVEDEYGNQYENTEEVSFS